MDYVAPPFDVRNALEDALVAASEDPTARGPFLRLLLDSTVFVIGHARDPSGTRVTESVTTLPTGASLALQPYPLRDGVTALPFYSSERWLSGCLRETVDTLEIPARALFDMSRGQTLVLNWGAPWGKEFTPKEIANLVDHGGAIERIIIEKARKVTFGLPAVEPTALLAALTTVLTKRPEVSAAYLGWMHDPASDVPPHVIIGFDGEGDLWSVVQDAGATATGAEWPTVPIDFMQVKAGDDGISAFLLNRGKRFYMREKA